MQLFSQAVCERLKSLNATGRCRLLLSIEHLTCICRPARWSSRCFDVQSRRYRTA
jgi:hypothetical protein